MAHTYYVTDFGSALVFEGGDGLVHIHRFVVWERKAGVDLCRFSDSGDHMAELQHQYKIDDARIIRLTTRKLS